MRGWIGENSVRLTALAILGPALASPDATWCIALLM